MLCPQCKNEMHVFAEFGENQRESWIFIQAICKDCVIGFGGPLLGIDLETVEELIEEIS